MTKHLDSLKIQNFRMLEDFEVEKLGQVNLIVGKNNSGKSTVLEALRIYAGNARPSLLEQIAKEHGESRTTKSALNLPFVGFFTKRIVTDNKYIVIGTTKSESERLSLRPIYVEKIQEASDDNNKLSQKFKEDISFIEPLTTNNYARKELAAIKGKNNIVSRISVDTTFWNSFFSEVSYSSREIHNPNIKNISCAFINTQLLPIDEIGKAWDDIVFTEYQHEIQDAMRIVVADFEDLTFIHEKDEDDGGTETTIQRKAIAKIKGFSYPVPLKSLGDGMQRILQIALNIYQAKDGFLLIDEFENGLHYSVQEKVWDLIFEMAKRLNIQVFATTHSWDCIEAFSEVASKREDVEGLLFSMGRSAKTSDNGKIIATIFDEAKLQRFTQADMDVR